MKMILYTRIVVEEPDGHKNARMGQIFVPDLNRLTDELCEQVLEEAAGRALGKYPAGSLVTTKEFISKSEYDAYCDIAQLMSGKDGEKRAPYTIYMKATGMFADPENRHGFGPSGPDIPFYVHSAKPFDNLKEEDKHRMKERVLSVCSTRFARTPAGIVFIEEEEYDRLISKILEIGGENEIE